MPIKATDLESRLNPDGSIDLRFSTDVEVIEVGLTAESAYLLLENAFSTAPELLPEHDEFQIAHMDGHPVLRFRFGQGWLSILLQPENLTTLRTVLKKAD